MTSSVKKSSTTAMIVAAILVAAVWVVWPASREAAAQDTTSSPMVLRPFRQERRRGSMWSPSAFVTFNPLNWSFTTARETSWLIRQSNCGPVARWPWIYRFLSRRVQPFQEIGWSSMPKYGSPGNVGQTEVM